MKFVVASAVFAMGVAASVAHAAPVAIYDLDDVVTSPLIITQPIVTDQPPFDGSWAFDGGSGNIKLMLDSLTIVGNGTPTVTGFMAELSDQEGFGSTSAVDVTASFGSPSSGMILVPFGETAYFNVKYTDIKSGGWEATFSAEITPDGVIPLPAALPLMVSAIGALGALGAAKRRRKA